jgi:S-DNA-T family DNA segregation ATPase FtsK/SpoIIIE
MFITLTFTTLLNILKIRKNENIIISQTPIPQTIDMNTNIIEQNIPLEETINDTELTNEVSPTDKEIHNKISDTNVKYNSLWSSNDMISDQDTIIKNRKNSNNYFGDITNSDINKASLIDNEIAPEFVSEMNKNDTFSPSLDLLQDLKEVSISQEELDATASNIKKTLKEYDVEVEIGQIQPGPVVTLYGLIPGWIKRTKKEKQFDIDGHPLLDERGKHILKEFETKNRVKVDSIMAREKDLSLALKTPSIRIETPVLGESLVGIEVPNPNPGVIGIKSLIKSNLYQDMTNNNDSLPIALGKGSGGDNVSIDLTKMPHLLIAGATGSGKSVCMNSIVSSLIYSKTPDQLRLLLVDPKRVELTQYNGIPHMISPVIVELDSVAKVFRGVINEMFKRYKLMESESVRNISELNKKFPNSMPYLVIVIDELADLMMTSGVEIERSICRLAQLGRATGIHLVVATQRPSVDIVTGLIKSNFPSRISFSVSSSIDSRTILDTTGAEKLLGKGDMLYLPVDGSMPSRLQGCFINDEEIKNLVDFWKRFDSQSYNYDINIFQNIENQKEESNTYNSSNIEKDSLFNDAVAMAKSTKKLSISFLQRKLRIGYPRAARLMDELEEEGIVGPMKDSAKSRDVIIN